MLWVLEGRISSIILLYLPVMTPLMYLAIKTLHLVAMVSWFAGLFYLPRLFIYHHEACAQGDAAGEQRFQTMECRLLHLITTPAGLVTWASGLVMLWMRPDLLAFSWMRAVLVLTFALALYHGWCALCYRGFCRSTLLHTAPPHSARFFRVSNEFPTLVLVAVMALFTFRPDF